MIQLNLIPHLEPTFDGDSFDAQLDGDRLGRQLALVREYVIRRGWTTLGDIERDLGFNAASASARLRDLRKAKFGGYIVERRRTGDPTRGVYEYRVRSAASEAA